MDIRKILLFLLTTILLSSFASAALNDGVVYYSFDTADLTGNDPNDVSGNGLDGTNNGADINQLGIINTSFDYISTNNDYVITPNITTNLDTIVFWLKSDNTITSSSASVRIV